MSKRINVNPDHHKVAGRERQGEDVIHERETPRIPTIAHAGISNRQSAEEEARERAEFPPIETGPPPPEDAAGRQGEQPIEDLRDRQTSHKAGSRSIAVKETSTRYPDRSMPPTHKVAGAFGREPASMSNDKERKERGRARRTRNR